MIPQKYYPIFLTAQRSRFNYMIPLKDTGSCQYVVSRIDKTHFNGCIKDIK